MSLLSIGKSGLLAAQVGLATTGNNITNANVPGYTRQGVIQTDTASQNAGFGFVGTGTEVSSVRRYYDNFLANQLRGAESNQASLTSYYTQISQIDNQLADPTAGLSPVLQDFFNGVQNATASPASAASRQAMLSQSESLAARFQSMSARLNEIGDGVNSQIVSGVGAFPEARYRQLLKRPLRLHFARQPERAGTDTHFTAYVRKFLIDWADENDYNLRLDGLVVQSAGAAGVSATGGSALRGRRPAGTSGSKRRCVVAASARDY